MNLETWHGLKEVLSCQVGNTPLHGSSDQVQGILDCRMLYMELKKKKEGQFEKGASSKATQGDGESAPADVGAAVTAEETILPDLAAFIMTVTKIMIDVPGCPMFSQAVLCDFVLVVSLTDLSSLLVIVQDKGSDDEEMCEEAVAATEGLAKMDDAEKKAIADANLQGDHIHRFRGMDADKQLLKTLPPGWDFF